MSSWVPRWIVGMVVITLTAQAGAQEQTDANVALPQDPRAWVNGSPISIESMHGKSIVLYFFEEDCPRCRAHWPDVLDAYRKVQGKPVMLIGVNSGNSVTDVARYVRENRISIPVIVDPYRTLEKSAGVSEISLQNIWQARWIGPEGEVRPVSAEDMETSLSRAAESSRWNVDPEGFPPALMPLWKRIEFGNFAGTGRELMRLARDRDAATRDGAARLQTYVEQQLQQIAEQATAASDPWESYKVNSRLVSEFAGFTQADQARKTIAELARTDEVRDQINALKQFELAERYSKSGGASAARSQAMLRKIIDRYPNTEAASRAEALLSP